MKYRGKYSIKKGVFFLLSKKMSKFAPYFMGGGIMCLSLNK